MTFRSWIWNMLPALSVNVSGMAAVMLFVGLAASWSVAAITVSCWALVLVVYLAVSYAAARARVKRMRALCASVRDKFLLSEIVPAPRGIGDRLYYELMLLQGRAAIGRVSAAERRVRERADETDEWAHELKIPLTAIKLICSRNTGDDFLEIRRQADRIGECVEKTLYLARSECGERDRMIRRTDLGSLVRGVLADNKRILIDAGASVTATAEGSVYTDAKWVGFVLRQLLMNAVQYAVGSAKIEISSSPCESGVELRVLDRGMGIPSCDLPRVFDRGFTGTNGRKNGGSTGMGLYICKKLCDALDIDLTARSEEGKYTEMILRFSSDAGTR